jgi:hypothetical protein
MSKTKMIRRALLAASLLGVTPSLPACVATVGVQGMSIPSDAAQTCAKHCQTIGMRLSAVAIMAENVGCVCQFPSEPKASAEAAGQFGAPIGGMAAVVMQTATRTQQQQKRP